MKQAFFLVACWALALLPLSADDTLAAEYPEGQLTEDQQIALLLQASENTCARLKALQAHLTAFRAQEAVCIRSPSNAEALYKLSECALALLTAIHDTHVEPYFRSAFLEELGRISKTARNRAIPPICTP